MKIWRTKAFLPKTKFLLGINGQVLAIFYSQTQVLDAFLMCGWRRKKFWWFEDL